MTETRKNGLLHKGVGTVCDQKEILASLLKLFEILDQLGIAFNILFGVQHHLAVHYGMAGAHGGPGVMENNLRIVVDAITLEIFDYIAQEAHFRYGKQVGQLNHFRVGVVL